MDMFTIKIAGMVLQVESLFGSTPVYFQKYLTTSLPDIRIGVSKAELLREQELLDAEADREGLKRRVFTGPFLERAVIQRKTAAAAAERRILLLHGSTVSLDGEGYLFTARTGTGKSTHTRLWRECFGERAVMVNDDRAFLDLGSETVTAYGSPWSGKHGLDSNIRVPLKGICLLTRGTENRLWPISGADALAEIRAQAFLADDAQEAQISALCEELVQRVPIWQMACTKSQEAALAAYEAMR